MKLLPDEKNLFFASLSEGQVILTTHRVQLNEPGFWGKQSFATGIFLEDISSIELKYKGKLWLLILIGVCVFCGVCGYLVSEDTTRVGGFLLASIIFIIWLLTRQRTISISSHGGASIDFIPRYMNDEKIDDFLYEVSLAKQTRANQLAKL